MFGGFWYYKYWEDVYRAAGFELVWAVGDPGLGTDRGRSGAP